MSQSIFGIRLHQVFGILTSWSRAKRRRADSRRVPRLESLERRALLANITASGVISSTADGSDFDYTIVLKNSSASDAGIGTFWYAWVPGEDFLATSPLSVTPPTGWSDQITNMGANDGYAIRFTANSSAYYVQPGSSLDFAFKSADTPASINGNSVFYPNTPVDTAFVYPQGPFSDSGHDFVVTPAPTLTSIAVAPTNPTVPKGETEQFTATGTFSDGSTENLTKQVTWSSATASVATISNTAGSLGLAATLATGTSDITATLNGVTGSTVLTVSPAVVVSIAVTTSSPSIRPGQTEQFTATGTLSDHSTENLSSQVTWSTASTSVATISATGLATGLAGGTTNVSAVFDGITGSAALNVALPPLVTLSQVQTIANKKHLVTEILVTFSGPVNASEAAETAIYHLATPGKNGSFTAKNAGTIKLLSAAYNAATDTVTLTPKKPFSLSKAVELTVNGSPPSGLQDSFGRLIDGAHLGQAGSNAVVVIHHIGVVTSAVALARSSAGHSVYAAALDAVLAEK